MTGLGTLLYSWTARVRVGLSLSFNQYCLSRYVLGITVTRVSVHCREFVHCSDFTVTVLSGGLPENRKTQQDAADPMKNTEYGIMTLNL